MIFCLSYKSLFQIIAKNRIFTDCFGGKYQFHKRENDILSYDSVQKKRMDVRFFSRQIVLKQLY